MSGSRRSPFELRLGAWRLCLGQETKIMGVLNVTPDSFSDGGRYLDAGLAESRALRMQEEGAHLIDVGGESTRPGSKPVSAREEIRRIRPVLKRLARKIQIPVSVDTYKPEVAAAALDEGAALINDVRALKNNKKTARLIARYKAGVALMHMRGTPATMQGKTRYRDVTAQVCSELRASLEDALEAGIDRRAILVDPGFGFAKTASQNVELLANLEEFKGLECPVLVGLSRKSFLGRLLNAEVGDRLYGSLGAAAAAIYGGAHMLRVHDVLAHRQLSGVIDGTLRNGG